MATKENKTTRTNKSVSEFLSRIKDEQRRKDAKQINTLMKDITGHKPVLWGSSIVGFGSYHYQYSSGREGDFMRIGFSPRANNLTIYIMPGCSDFGDLLKKLGPYSKGKSCLYIKRLDDVHIPTLKKIIKKGWKEMQKLYPES